MQKIQFNRFKLLSFASLTILLSACGGGGGGGSNNSAGAVEASDIIVSAITPAPFTSQVDRDTSILVQFSGDLFAPSVNNSSVQLLKDGELLAGNVSLPSTNTIDFATDGDLDLLSLYNGRVTTEVTDLDGRPLAQAIDWPFITRDGIWRERQDLATGAVDNPVLVTAGDRFWAFHQRDNLFSGQNDIFFRSLREDGVWESSHLVSNSDSDSDVVGGVNAAVLSSGDLLAVWQEHAADGTDELWYNRFNSESGNWGESARITLDNTNKRNPQIVTNPAGNIAVLFEFDDNLAMATDLRSIAYSVEDDQWLQEQHAANDLDLAAGEGQASMAMDSAGNMMLVYFRSGVIGDQVAARYYDGQQGEWSDLDIIDTPDSEDTHIGIQVVVDSQDNFMAAWSQEDDALGFSFIWTNRYIPGQGWQQTQAIIGSILGVEPAMVVSRDDNIMLIWRQDVVAGADSLLFSGFNAMDNDWTSAELLENSEQTASQHQLTVDHSGNIMAIWHQNHTGTFVDSNANIFLNPEAIWARRFDNTTDGIWRDAQAISSAGGALDNPVFTTNASGEIIALWGLELDGDTSIQSRYFN